MSDPIRALVVDDEPLARVNLRALLSREAGWLLVQECANGRAALQAMQQHRPDVVFLDIRMPGLSGLEVAEQLSRLQPPPLVVFATAFEEHALDAFAVEAADYLVKPFDQERFLITVRRLERRLRRVSPNPTQALGETVEAVGLKMTAAPAAGAAATPLSSALAVSPTGELTAPSGSRSEQGITTLAVRSVGRVRLVEVADIHWLGAAGNYVRLYLSETCFLHRATLGSLEKDLPSSRFLRIHRSTLVNRSQVVELRTSVAGRYQLVLRDGTELEISQRFKRQVFAALLP